MVAWAEGDVNRQRAIPYLNVAANEGCIEGLHDCAILVFVWTYH